MREIKFRGERLDNGEWVYGSLLLDRDNGLAWIVSVAYNALYPKTDEQNLFRVDPETVGQYTGLKDMKGVHEIFERDFVDLHGSLAVITWEWGGFIAKIVKAANVGDREGLNYPMTIDGECGLPFEVVGNVHDNPELLEANS